MTVRAGVVIVSEDKVAMIRRHRDGESYYAFPGGKVEPGELAKQAAAREAAEELGLEVEVGAHVATVTCPDGTIERYFLATATSGTLGSGTGPEMQGDTHEAVWIEVGSLTVERVLPGSLARFVHEGIAGGWPERPANLER